MKIALLIPGWYPDTEKHIWQWITPRERELSKEYLTREEALQHRPNGYLHLDDGWDRINN